MSTTVASVPSRSPTTSSTTTGADSGSTSPPSARTATGEREKEERDDNNSGLCGPLPICETFKRIRYSGRVQEDIEQRGRRGRRQMRGRNEGGEATERRANQRRPRGTGLFRDYSTASLASSVPGGFTKLCRRQACPNNNRRQRKT